MYDPSQPPLVSETLLKKRRNLDELALRRSMALRVPNQRRKVTRGEDIRIKRPEQFVTECRIREGSANKMNRRKKKVEKMKNPVPKRAIQDTVGFVVRIHGGRHSSPAIKTELRKLGLLKKYDATFVKLDGKGVAALKPLDAYLAYGYITKKSVEELVHRRAFIETAGEDGSKLPMPLSDNITVENALGTHNIICLNDLSHEIYTVGTNFEAATQFLTTFHLSSPVGQYEKKVLQVHDDVEKLGGFLGADMETFLHKIL